MAAGLGEWLARSAIPLWLDRGVDRERGGFFEELTLSAEPVVCPKRAMVQARQLYVFSQAAARGYCDSKRALQAVESGRDFLLSKFVHPSGAFRHSVQADGSAGDDGLDLYAQAFVIFGLAHAYARLGDPKLKARASGVLSYLRKERALKGGGFSEQLDGKAMGLANPHMHLLEAALAWIEAGEGPGWRELADELVELCLSRLIDSESGALAEIFDGEWKLQREGGRFFFEPGHQYEWAWLLGRYGKIAGKDLRPVSQCLFDLAETHGVCPSRHSVYDEVWSDLTPKRTSSRLWPQCERIKAAVQLGLRREAEEAASALMRFFETQMPGLWLDRWNESGDFVQQNAKASSLYHIVGAVLEFEG